MLDEIKRAYGVDLEELASEHLDTLMTDRDEDDVSVLQALGTAALIHGNHGNIMGIISAIRIAWAVGRKSGRAEPDLSVFEDALK